MHKNFLNKNTPLNQVQERTDIFAKLDGRRPRVLISSIPNNKQDFKTKMLANSFADLGFDVDICPSNTSPLIIAKQAIENDVHVILVDIFKPSQNLFISEIIKALMRFKRLDIFVVVNGNFNNEEGNLFKDSGTALVNQENQPISNFALNILELLMQ